MEKDETLAAFILFTCISLVQDDETGGELTQRGCPMSTQAQVTRLLHLFHIGFAAFSLLKRNPTAWAKHSQWARV